MLVVRGAADVLARALQMGLETHEDAFALARPSATRSRRVGAADYGRRSRA